MERFYKRKSPSLSTSDGTMGESSKVNTTEHSSTCSRPIDVVDMNDLHSDIVEKEYRIRLNVTIDACRFLLKCDLPFRGHSEEDDSILEGLFLETLDFMISQNEDVRKVTLRNAPANHEMVAPCSHKDVATCFEEEILKCIFKEIDNDVFALLVDESSDVSKKEHLTIVLRFVGLVHVTDTSSSSFKTSINSFFAKHKLSWDRVRGQGYNEASNMYGEFNGLKAKILEENNSAYYVYCFAHQLQLVVVAVARKHLGVVNFFDMLATLTNVVCASCEQKDILQELEKERVVKEFGNDDLETGSGLNQELSLKRARDTRWNSHYNTILRLVTLFPSVIKVLEYVEAEGTDSSNKNQASGLLDYLESFDFVFYLHLMLHILGVTNILSRALQRKDQDILEALKLVSSTKEKLQEFRRGGFDALLETIISFCGKHDITVLKMEENYVNLRSKRQRANITNRHYYEFDCFNTVLDMLVQEFGDRFDEVNIELLTNMAALNPSDVFSKFDATKLMRLSEMYPYDFDDVEKITLEHQLDMYHYDVRNDEDFANLNGIADLSRQMVKTRKHLSYPLVYRLLKLTLVLPVATAPVERCFSEINLVKTDLRNQIGDDFLNAYLMCAVEKEIFVNVSKFK